MGFSLHEPTASWFTNKLYTSPCGYLVVDYHDQPLYIVPPTFFLHNGLFLVNPTVNRYTFTFSG